MVTVNVSDRSPKAIIRYIIIEGKSPCDIAGLNDLLDEWLNGAPGALLRRLLPAPGLDAGQILSLLDYQCALRLWRRDRGRRVKAAVTPLRPHRRDQGLPDVETARVTRAPIPALALNTRATSLLVWLRRTDKWVSHWAVGSDSDLNKAYTVVVNAEGRS